MTRSSSHRVDLDDTQTWHKYRKGMCDDCHACCCAMPVEVRLADLIRMGLVDAFEAGEPLKQVAKRLQQARVIDQFNHASGIFVLARRANGDCLYLTQDTRRCSIYEQRPQTCRNHPQKGPRPGFCAYRPKQQAVAGSD